MGLTRLAVAGGLLCGFGLIVTGIALVYVPAALIAAGAIIAGVCLFVVDVGGDA